MSDLHITAENHPSPGPWWAACDHPEKPGDQWVLWSWDCDACIMHLAAAAAQEGGIYAEHYASTIQPTATTVAGTLAAARVWRAEQGMREL